MKLLACCVAPLGMVLLSACATKPLAFTTTIAIATIYQTVGIGDEEQHAITKLERAGFRCRQLAPHEFASLGPEPVKAIWCHTEADRTAEGYTLVYASLAANRSGQLTQVHADWYPVVFRNVRQDTQGRTIVTQDQTLVRPVVAQDSLRGRWTIAAVNGRKVAGPWIEFGAEGLGTVTKRGNAVFVASPQPPTQTYLGCNNWYPNGWSRNGDKLTFGREMSRRTERGCDAARAALDDEAYAILIETMTIEFAPPDGLRLINENGSLDLVRDVN